MKTKLYTILATLILALGVSLSARAQTPPTPTDQPPTSTGTFFTSVESYFSSFNTNNDGTFAQQRGKLFTGVASIQGGATPLANVVGATYDVYKPTNSSVSLSIGTEVLNSGVAGTFVSGEIGPELNFVIHDVEVTGFLHGGYNAIEKDNAYFGVAGVRLLKALTAHTYAGMELGIVLPGNEQRICAVTGFSF